MSLPFEQHPIGTFEIYAGQEDAALISSRMERIKKLNERLGVPANSFMDYRSPDYSPKLGFILFGWPQYGTIDIDDETGVVHIVAAPVETDNSMPRWHDTTSLSYNPANSLVTAPVDIPFFVSSKDHPTYQEQMPRQIADIFGSILYTKQRTYWKFLHDLRSPEQTVQALAKLKTAHELAKELIAPAEWNQKLGKTIVQGGSQTEYITEFTRSFHTDNITLMQRRSDIRIEPKPNLLQKLFKIDILPLHRTNASGISANIGGTNIQFHEDVRETEEWLRSGIYVGKLLEQAEQYTSPEQLHFEDDLVNTLLVAKRQI